MDFISLLGGQLYLIGGRNNSSNGNMDSDSVERYDPLYDEWSNVASLTVPRNRLGVAVVDGVVYAVGGSDGIEIIITVIIIIKIIIIMIYVIIIIIILLLLF